MIEELIGLPPDLSPPLGPRKFWCDVIDARVQIKGIESELATQVFDL